MEPKSRIQIEQLSRNVIESTDYRIWSIQSLKKKMFHRGHIKQRVLRTITITLSMIIITRVVLIDDTKWCLPWCNDSRVLDFASNDHVTRPTKDRTSNNITYNGQQVSVWSRLGFGMRWCYLIVEIQTKPMSRKHPLIQRSTGLSYG